MKRWANFYFQLSPIFKAPEFTQPGHEALMAINTRLFSAYCAGMLRAGHYDGTKIKALTQQYSSKEDFSTQYLQYLIGDSQECPTNSVQEQHVEKVTKFRELVSRLFRSELKRE